MTKNILRLTFNSLLILPLLAASGASVAAVKATRISGIYSFSAANSGWGKAITVGVDGSVFVAGEYFGGANYDIRVSQLNPATLAVSWVATLDPGSNNYVTGMAADSGQVYVCGRGSSAPTDGFVAVFGTGNGSLAWNKGAAVNEGFYGVALDAVAGEVLAIGSSGTDAYLARFSTAGGVLTARQFKHASNTSGGRAVAVSGERIFVGGYAGTGPNPWIYCLDRVSGQKVWSTLLATDAGQTVTSLAVVGGNVYALVVGEYGNNGHIVILDSAGTEVKRGELYAGGNCAACSSPNPYPPPQQVVLHPTLPLLFVVSGYQRNILMALDLDLNILWTQPAIVPSEGASTMEWISGVAASSGLNSAVYVVGQQMVSGPIYRMKAGGFTLENAEIAAEKLVIAPNRLELAGKIREISIIVRDDAGKKTVIKVFDGAGRLVKTIEGTVGAGGVFEARWDGTGGSSGVILAPGIYWVRVDGQKTAKPVMLTTEVK